MIKKLYVLAVGYALLCLWPLPSAAQIFDWSSNNIQLLRGHHYELGNEERTLMTLEHAHGWAYGDTFVFLDWTWPDDGKPDYYGEIAPRLSLSKIFNTDLSAGIIQDILISTTLEKGKHAAPNYLIGGAIDFDLPGFTFFKANAYWRDDPDLSGSTWQVTLSWEAPFELGQAKLVTEGFADFAGREGSTYDPNQLIVPRFLLDIGHFWQEDGKIFAGVEYSYWHNQFGIDGVTESVPQAMIKWVF